MPAELADSVPIGDLSASAQQPVETSIPPPPGESRQRQLFRTVLNVLLPSIGIGLFLVVLNWGPIWLGLQKYEVPTLSESLSALKDNWGVIGPELHQSIADALAGFLVGNLLALLGAILFCQSRTVERTFFPLAVVFQAIPIVVIAPVSLQIFASLGWGPYDALPVINSGLKPILLVTVLITFFPTLVNMTFGLKDIDSNLYELMRLIGSSPLRLRIDAMRRRSLAWSPLARAVNWLACAVLSAIAEVIEQLRILRRLRLPSSMPYLFTSLKITATLCFVGAFVGEYVVSANVGIGGFIKTYTIQQEWPQAFACVLAFVLATLAWVGIVALAEKLLFTWRVQQ